ncbi:NYN domain-containing protein [Nocardia camponoti]|uniref:NYN domain-containing protein n=1 Tax=Nocardia camponoti TaxID=1616106 RepID=A0A917QT02_9NOCA|nr:NYN domain-containing protein [Nocardia camponoti]GGK66990.1 NYN domain-containing protein [Nocardia camponoti]
MRSNCSVYIDAGYLLASAAVRVAGTSLRNGIHVNYAPLIDQIQTVAQEYSGLPLLRAHWYDAAKDAVPDAQQQRIGELPRTKLRLGRIGMDGLQKGVDLRIGLDMAAHARNRIADVFILVSGDDDLTEAVEEAQSHGVQVIVMAVPNANDKPHAVSHHLIRAADEIALLPGTVIDETVMRVEAPPVPKQLPVSQPAIVAQPQRSIAPQPAAVACPTPRDLAAAANRAPAAAPTATLAYSSVTGSAGRAMPGFTQEDEAECTPDTIDAVVDKVVSTFVHSASADDLAQLRRDRPSIPRDIDRALLLDAAQVTGVYDLSEYTRYQLRERFWKRVLSA